WQRRADQGATHRADFRSGRDAVRSDTIHGLPDSAERHSNREDTLTQFPTQEGPLAKGRRDPAQLARTARHQGWVDLARNNHPSSLCLTAPWSTSSQIRRMRFLPAPVIPSAQSRIFRSIPSFRTRSVIPSRKRNSTSSSPLAPTL